MAAVPVQTPINSHVETDQGDLPSAPLRDQVKTLKAGVAAVADDTGPLHQERIAPAVDCDLA